MPETFVNPTTENNQEESNFTSNLDKNISRRDFLKLGGLIAAGAALASCDIKPENIFSSEKDNLKNNTAELNNQFEQIKSQYVNEQGYFNYERFKTNPEFDRYILEIDSYSNKIGNETGINPNALRLITSSIVATNLDNWKRIGESISTEEVRERVGPMQFYPENVLNTLKNKLKDNHNYSTMELEGLFNIDVGIKHLVYGCLGDINNDGENRNLITLTLAQYYGGSNLVTYVKGNKEVPEDNYLRENYNLLVKTLNTMGISSTFSKSNNNQERGNIEVNMEEIWDKATRYWPETNIKFAKEYFFKHAQDYFDDQYNEILGLSEEEYLALFISIAMVESNGGTKLEPHSISGARGWFQVIPKYHLNEYNADVGSKKNRYYNERDLVDNMEASIEVGIWALMRYRHSSDYQDIKKLMKMFKGGRRFGENWDDGIWWNRVSFCMTKLIGIDSLGLGYMDYELPQGTKKEAHEFKGNNEHIGNVLVRE
jgi:hypothetical protein